MRLLWLPSGNLFFGRSVALDSDTELKIYPGNLICPQVPMITQGSTILKRCRLLFDFRLLASHDDGPSKISKSI
ncbi:uncharacterized protein ARMOST_01201 [Armillaria ostoyae]|uniref:Uncharacterized protein n=1 Tax=Armillaria ostoyae TaxID=47428 RepID=A0A284QNA2_ARMOS|nr:uncharacterized protein ARMOST_01201 [Armillaria ostoyae]